MLKKLLISLLLLLVFPLKVQAQEVECLDRYLTIVNPVRGRNVWFDADSKNFEDQYKLIEDRGFSATWLLTYDALVDERIIQTVKDFDNKQEIGLFLEVTEDLTYRSDVIYPHAVEWYDPNAVFLSAYSRSERIRLTDALFEEYKSNFGKYPKSVGAWWIDSYSSDYMVDKYGIQTAMIVADQRTTDSYGVWGQWWGVPFVAKSQNILVPERNPTESNLAVIQWAQRDFSMAYGDGPEYSNHSLQANDYIERGLDTEYFKELSGKYLDCSLPVGQITVGLETGQEGLLFIEEYENQLDYLSNVKGLQSVTMSEFSEILKNRWYEYPEEIRLADDKSQWVLGFNGRENEVLRERVLYSNNSFADYFVADKNEFLNRNLNNFGSQSKDWYPVYIVPLLLSFMIFKQKAKHFLWLSSTLFIILAFFPLLASNYKLGWAVYFGPVVQNLMLFQFMITVTIYLLVYSIDKKQHIPKLLLILAPAIFGIDTLLRLPKYTSLDGVKHIGLTLNTFDFYGITINGGIGFVYKELPNTIASSLLKFNYLGFLNNSFHFFIVMPTAHVIGALVLFVIVRKIKPNYRKLAIAALLILAGCHLYYLINLDPQTVLAIK